MQSRLTGGMPAKLTQGPRAGYDLSRLGAGAARGANRKKKLEAAPWSGTWPAPGATLDLDFANNRGFVRGLGQGGVMDGITFTRASNATYVGQDGLLKGYTQGGNNLLSFPQDFDNAAWSKAGVTVTAKTTDAPDGTNTGTFVSETTINNEHSLVQGVLGAFTIGAIYTFSAHFKAGSRQYGGLTLQNNNGAYIYVVADFASGTVTKTGSAGVSSTDYNISVAGNGWWRVSVTMASTTTSFYPQLFISDVASPSAFIGGRPVYQGDGTSGIFIWGAQLELGSTATEYFPTNINVPRFDWAGTEVVANKNLLRNTETFSDWSILRGALSRSATTPPAGIASSAAEFFQGSGQTASAVLFLATPSMEGSVSFSFYAKANSLTSIGVSESIQASGSRISSFDLSTGIVTGTGTGHTPSISSVGFGWYRCSIAFSVASRSGNAEIRHLTTTEGSVFVTGAQLEEGATATDYQAVAQPTTNTPLRPTATCNGLLIEEARTNRILWCRDATQSNWVKIDITAAKDQTGIDGVANAASSLLATADGGTCIQTITLASGSRTGSVYLKRLTGTGIVQVSLDGSTWSTVDLSDTEWRRIVLSGTVTNPVVGIRLATLGDAVAMDFGQVEDGGFVTTPILTTSAASTRATEQSPYPSVQVQPGVYDVLTKDRQSGVFSNAQTVTASRSITPNSGLRYITRLIAYATSYLKGEAKSLLGVKEL